MTEPVQAVAVTDDALRVRVAPVVALRTAWKTTALNAFSFVASFVLLALGYLQTVNLSAILTPRDALLWTAAVNLLTLFLRALGTRPIVLDPPRDVTVRAEDRG